MGAGRSKWRDAQGRIAGRDNANGGMGIAQQWEVLCPSGGKRAPKAKSPAAAGASAVLPAGQPKAPYAAGQVVMAKYGSQWIRAKVNRVRQVNGRSGPERVYDVTLDKGQRGLLPANMLRMP